MDDGGISSSLSRAERALDRIEREIARRNTDTGREQRLRAKVREAVAELDQLIGQANG